MKKNSENEIAETKSKELLGRIGHEMGNAVTIIRCSLNIIKSKHPQVSETTYFNTAVGEMEYLEELINDIKNYNQVIILNKNMCDLYKLTNEVVDFANLAPWSENVKFVIRNNTSEKEILINIDNTKIKQVLINLIKNGCEAIGEKGIENGKVEILLTSEKIFKNSYIVVSVTDNGIGIEEEKIRHIFEPMTTYKVNGTGLGLAIVKEIVKSHNGKVEVYSSEGKTTFKIYLPT